MARVSALPIALVLALLALCASASAVGPAAVLLHHAGVKLLSHVDTYSVLASFEVAQLLDAQVLQWHLLL